MKTILDFINESPLTRNRIAKDIGNTAAAMVYAEQYSKDHKLNCTFELNNNNTIDIVTSKNFIFDDPIFFDTLNSYGVNRFRFGMPITIIDCHVPTDIEIECVFGNQYDLTASMDLLKSSCKINCSFLRVKNTYGNILADIDCSTLYIDMCDKPSKFDNLHVRMIDVNFPKIQDVSKFVISDYLKFTNKCNVEEMYVGFEDSNDVLVYSSSKKLKYVAVPKDHPEPYRDDQWFVWIADKQ